MKPTRVKNIWIYRISHHCMQNFTGWLLNIEISSNFHMDVCPEDLPYKVTATLISISMVTH
jgi:hypothetical protein